MTEPATILVVEDDEMIRLAVANGLRLDGHPVVEASTLAEARQGLLEQEVHLVLLDVELPDGSGLSLLSEMRDQDRWQPVLVLTARGSEEDRVMGFQHGCDDYVVKPFSLAELRLRIHALLRRQPQVAADDAAVSIGGVQVEFAAFRLLRGDGEVALSPRECGMLRYFLDHPGKVLSRDDFLRDVWGYEKSPLTRTVDMHVRKLREKIEDDPQAPRHFVTVHGAGYRFDP